jgi:hypothetical protein
LLWGCQTSHDHANYHPKQGTHQERTSGNYRRPQQRTPFLVPRTETV